MRFSRNNTGLLFAAMAGVGSCLHATVHNTANDPPRCWVLLVAQTVLVEPGVQAVLGGDGAEALDAVSKVRPSDRNAPAPLAQAGARSTPSSTANSTPCAGEGLRGPGGGAALRGVVGPGGDGIITANVVTRR